MLRKGTGLRKFREGLDNQLIEVTLPVVAGMQKRYLTEPEKGIYQYTWPVMSNMETELLLQGQKIMDIQCNCNDPSVSDDMCMHMIALLLFVEKIFSVRAKPVIKKSNSAKDTRATTNFLDDISYEALKAFVRDYARRDKDFGLELKAAFVDVQSNGNESFTYDDLVNQLLKHTRSSNNNWSLKKASKLEQFNDRLLDQCRAMILEKNYRNAFMINLALLQKVLPICYLHNHLKPFKNLASKIESITVDLIQLELAPTLKLQLGQMIKNSINASWYFPEESKKTLFHTTHRLLIQQDIDVQVLIHKVVEAKYDRASYPVLLAWLTFFLKTQLKQEWLKDHSWSLEPWSRYLEVLRFEENVLLCSPGIRQVYHANIPKPIRFLAIQELLTWMNMPELQRPFVQEIAEMLLRPDAEVAFPLIHRTIHTELIKALERNCKSAEDFKHLAKFCQYTDKMDHLLDLIDHRLHIDLLAGTIDALDNKDIQVRIQPFSLMIQTFLKDYYGEKNILKVIGVLTVIKSKGLDKEFVHLYKQIVQSTGKRALLMEKLEENFPKAHRLTKP